MSSSPLLDSLSALAASGDDNAAELTAILENYLEALESGRAPDRAAILAAHPHLATALAENLAKIEALHAAATGLAGFNSRLTGLSYGADAAPKELGDFRILRELGRGGMGIVYEAEQLSLRRRVAVKVLPLAGVLDKRALARFHNEATAAATLFHPHIVPVFFVGAERGVHFYAMQLIEGQSLAEVIDQMRNADSGLRNEQETNSDQSAIPNPQSAFETQSIAALATERSSNPRAYFRRVAEIGIQIAEALDHAHEHGILHRDVKPANILLDDEGKAWITDFGLARLESDASKTMTGDLVGTLRYMSPEQALAKRVAVDQRTDVYSLSATLYELLTLTAAFDDADRQELMRRIAFEEPCRSRKRNPAVPQELDTIVVKGLEKNPDHRYDSAGQLADDLRRFLDDKPICAKRASLLQRTGKWSRRHKSLVASAVVILVLATIGLAIISVLLGHERSVAEQQRDEADRQRKAAQENFQRARKAVDEYLTRVSEDQLLNAPSLQPLRKDLLTLALKYYQEFVAEHSDDTTLLPDLAAAYDRVGQITSEIGSKKGALIAHQEAMAIRKKLVNTDPTDAVARNLLAESYRSIGALQIEIGALDDALASLQKSIEISEKLVSEHSDSIYEHSLAKSYLDLGGLQDTIASPEQAFHSRTKALESYIELVAGSPNSADYRYGLALSHHGLGKYHFDLRDLPAARASNQSAIEIMKSLVEENPADLKYRLRLAKFHASDGVIESNMGNTSAGIALEQSAINTIAALVRENSAVSDFRQELAFLYVNLGISQGHARMAKEAIASLKEAASIYQTLLNENPEVHLYAAKLAQAYGNMAAQYSDAGLSDEAIASYHDSLSILKALVDQHSSITAYWNSIDWVYKMLGCLLYDVDRHEEAAALYREALADEVTHLRNSPKHKVRTGFACLAGCIVVSEADNAQVHSLDHFFEGQISTWKDLQSACDDKSGCLVHQATLYRAFAIWLNATQRESAAKENVRLAMDAARHAAELDAKSNAWGIWSRAALDHYRQHNWRGAEADARLAIKLAGDNPDLLIEMAPLLLLADKEGEYQQLCIRLINARREEGKAPSNVGWSAEWTNGCVVRMCGLDPNVLGEPSRDLKMALQAPEHFDQESRYAVGRAYYRAGDFPNSVDWLRKTLDGARRKQLPIIFLDLAIAHHHEGNHAEARAWWNRACEYLDDREYWDIRPHPTMEIEVLRQEAKKLFQAQATP